MLRSDDTEADSSELASVDQTEGAQPGKGSVPNPMERAKRYSSYAEVT